MDAFLAVGRIVSPHGIRGEVKIDVMTDFPSRFDPGSQLWLEGETAPCQVVAARSHKGHLLVQLDCLADRTAAEWVNGRYLLIPRDQAHVLPAGEYYQDELVGLEVVSEAGQVLGHLAEVVWTGANEVYLIEGALGELLIPAVAEVVQEVDLQRGRMVVKLIPGLLPELETVGGAPAGD
ncbi:MAG: 16S rRNA processing protein RimM [Caldilineales bacterium]|nr:16S rRNA processing protein RimM [Caldilineales bacterium]